MKTFSELREEINEACWKGYKQVGGKEYDVKETRISELSNDTLKSYSDKAKASAKYHDAEGDRYASDRDERAFAPSQYKKAASRTAGAAKADSKMKEEMIQEGHYEDAEDHLSKANDADAKGDKLAFHGHMADHHDSMSQWHEDKGRSASADKHAEKAEQHHEKAVELSKESIDEDHVKVGDEVHAGLGQKGGAGFKGTVHKIEGEHVYVKLDSGKYGSGKYGDRIVKAHHSKVTKEEVEQLDERGANKYKRPTEKGAGLTRAGVMKYRRENPGSKLSTAVTKEPSKLKKGSKAWNRRKSFCARMSGVKGPMKDSKGRPTRKAMSLRRWHCEE